MNIALTSEMLTGARNTLKLLTEKGIFATDSKIISQVEKGYGRFHYLDTAKFCSNARGSVYEVLDHLITAEIEMLISAELLATGREKVETAIRLLNGYIHYLQNKAKTPNGPNLQSLMTSIPNETNC